LPSPPGCRSFAAYPTKNRTLRSGLAGDPANTNRRLSSPNTNFTSYLNYCRSILEQLEFIISRVLDFKSLRGRFQKSASSFAFFAEKTGAAEVGGAALAESGGRQPVPQSGNSGGSEEGAAT
jgi:hypothetical protein